MSTSTDRHQASRDDERRYAARIPEQCSAVVLLPNRRRIKGETVDLSSAGVCLTLPQALELGHEYHFHIDREVNDRKQSVDVVGRVCFCISRGDQFRIGIHCPDMQLSARL
jgi:PilZ domain